MNKNLKEKQKEYLLHFNLFLSRIKKNQFIKNKNVQKIFYIIEIFQKEGNYFFLTTFHVSLHIYHIDRK